MPIAAPIIRLFVSSTFSDFKAERNVLQRDIFPELRRLCHSLGLRFQPIDLRWGVSEEAGQDNRTMRICLRELRRCQLSGSKPNFLVLLGDRYGWHPLPELIPANIFERLQQKIIADPPRDGGVKTPAAPLLQRWYRRDDNAVPPQYVLQPRVAPYDCPTVWTEEVEGPLLAALKSAAETSGLVAAAAAFGLGCSATHQEIQHGALNLRPEDVRTHVHAFVRSLQCGDGQSPPTGFIDRLPDGTVDLAARAQMLTLRATVGHQLSPDNVHAYSVSCPADGALREDDLTAFREAVLQVLSTVIRTQAAASSGFPLTDQTESAHRDFGAERRTGFVGRASELRQVADYLTTPQCRPMIVLGPAGSGKTALVSEVVARARGQFPAAVVLERYFGATAEATRLAAVLYDVVTRIHVAYPAPVPAGPDGIPVAEKPVPLELNELVMAFHAALRRATADQPLFVFLDALDQFAGPDVNSVISCVPEKLPPNVRFLVSAAQPSSAASDHRAEVQSAWPYKFGSESRLVLPPLQRADGGPMLDRWLATAGRTLQPPQRSAVLDTFAIEGNPLWLRTAAEETSRLPSWAPAPRLPSATDELMGEVLARWSREHEHGAALVHAALGYLACARFGLSEDELLELLSADPEVMADFRRRFPRSPAVDALPVAAWVPLLGDLSGYLNEDAVQGARLLRFYHRVLPETVAARLSAEPARRLKYERGLAAYFTLQARGVDASHSWSSTQARGFAECVYHQTTAQQWDNVVLTMSEFRFLLQKTRLGLLENLLDDWAMLEREAPDEIRRRLEILQTFFRGKSHVLRRGNAAWPAYKIFLQLAVEEADDSPLNIAAERYLDEGGGDWLWLRRVPRSTRSKRNACLAVIEDSNWPKDVMALGQDRIATWGSELSRQDHTLRIWDINSGRQIVMLRGHFGEITGAHLCSDGRILSWAGTVQINATERIDNSIRYWDPRTGVELARTVFGSFHRVVVLPEDRIVTWRNGDSTLNLWRPGSQQPYAVLKGHYYPVSGVCSLPGNRILTWSGDRSLRIWDADPGELIRAVMHLPESVKDWLPGVDGVAYVPPAMILSWKSNDRFSRYTWLHLWNYETGETVTRLEGEHLTVDGVVPFANGDIVLWSARDGIRKWNPASTACVISFDRSAEGLAGACALGDDRLLSWSYDGLLRIWDVGAATLTATLRGHSGRVEGVGILPNGRLVSWATDQSIRSWDPKSGNALASFVGHAHDARGVLPLSGDRFVSWSLDGTLRVWDANADGMAPLAKAHQTKVRRPLLLPERFATWASEDRILRVWSSESGECLAELDGHTKRVTGALVLAEDRLMSWADDCRLRIWNVRGGQCTATLDETGENLGAIPVAADRVLSWARSRNELRVWDSCSGKLLRVLAGHTDKINGALALPDRRVLSWSGDTTLRLWAIDSGECLGVLNTENDVRQAFVVSDRICSWCGGRFQVWNLRTLRCTGELSGFTYGDMVMNARSLAGGQRLLTLSGSSLLEIHHVRLWDVPTCTLIKELTDAWGAIVLEDGRLLSWSIGFKSARLWDPLSGECLAVVPEGGALAEIRDWAWERAVAKSEDRVHGGYHVLGRGPVALLRKIDVRRELAAWHAESQAASHHVLADGTVLVTQTNGQVCCLKLHFGAKRVSLAETDRLLADGG